MARDFDPYYKWLGIPPRDQPPHHYRLLGIETFEQDRDVIDAAANRLMAYLKELAMGDNAAHSQRLLNEIAQARICLLNAARKADYDQTLRQEQTVVNERRLRDWKSTASRNLCRQKRSTRWPPAAIGS